MRSLCASLSRTYSSRLTSRDKFSSKSDKVISMDKQEQKEIYYLSDYNWERGYIISVGPKNFKIKNAFCGYEVRISKNKCALPDESVCVVWETWKGKNGRGAYRVERELYSDLRVRADQVARQMGNGRVDEKEKPNNGE